jgi:hypothetical protein
MSPKLILDAIEAMTLAMPEAQQRERWQNYAAVRVMTDDLFAHATELNLPTGYIREKIVRLLMAVRQLADLEERASDPTHDALDAIQLLQAAFEASPNSRDED